MTEASLRRQVELLTSKLGERNTIIGTLTQQVDILQSQLGALQDSDSSSPDEPAPASDAKGRLASHLRHEEALVDADLEGRDSNENLKLSTGNPRADDEEDGDETMEIDENYWEPEDGSAFEGIWRCRACHHEVTFSECDSDCGLQQPDFEDVAENTVELDYARILSGHAYQPVECCQRCLEIVSLQFPPNWTPAVTPWAALDLDTALGLSRTLSDSEATSLLQRGASPAMIKLFRLSYSPETGIVAFLDEALLDEVGDFAVDDECKVFLGASISLEKDDLDGSTFMYEIIDDVSNAFRRLESEHVWVVVSTQAVCGHWAPTLPPVFESKERASETLFEDSDYQSTEDEGEGEGSAPGEHLDGMELSTEPESEAEGSERGSSLGSDDSITDVESSKGGGGDFWAGFKALVGEKEPDDAIVQDEAAPSSQSMVL